MPQKTTPGGTPQIPDPKWRKTFLTKVLSFSSWINVRKKSDRRDEDEDVGGNPDAVEDEAGTPEAGEEEKDDMVVVVGSLERVIRCPEDQEENPQPLAEYPQEQAGIPDDMMMVVVRNLEELIECPENLTESPEDLAENPEDLAESQEDLAESIEELAENPGDLA